MVSCIIGTQTSSNERDAAAAKAAAVEAARIAKLTPEQRAIEEKRKTQKAAEDAAREKAWGVAQVAAAAIRKGANDPESISFTEASFTDDGTVLLEYRGKNAFGALIKNYAIVTPDGRIDIGSQEKVASTWNKHIANRRLTGLPNP